MHRLLMVLLLAGFIAGQGGIGATAYFIDAELNADSTFQAWVSSQWVQTTQGDFQAGVLDNVDTSSSAGDVKLVATSAGMVTDTFADESKIASKTNLVVTGGQVKLTSSGSGGTEVLRPNAAGTYSQCDRAGAFFNYWCVDEAVADEDSTYVYTWYGATELDTYNIADHSQGTGAINSVTVYIRSRGTSSSTSAPALVGSWTGETDFDTNGFSYTPGAGSNRVALVMVTAESNSNPVANINQVTLGGQALTAIENADGVVVGSAGSYHNVVWFGYLNEAGIDNMSGNALNITWDTAPTNSPPIMVQAATYQNVDQTTPVADSASNTAPSAGSIQAGSVSVGSDDRLVYVTVCGNPRDHAAPFGYTEQIEQDGPPMSHSSASVHRDATTSSIENPTADWGFFVNERLAIISAVLNAAGSGASVAAAEVAIRTNGSDYFGSYTASLPTSYTDISANWTENPNTSNDWTWAEIDALEAGVRQYDLGAGDVRTTQVYVEVDYSGSIIYDSPGTLTSVNLLSGETVDSIDSFDYNASAIPSGTSLKVQFSQDSTNWYNSAGTAGGWDTLSQGTNSIDLSGLGWSGANFYYQMEFTSDGTDTPVLDDITVNFSTVVVDTFADESKIASKTNLVVTGGQVKLTSSGSGGTETLRPNAAGTYSQCDWAGAYPNFQCIDEAVADEDSTYVYTWFGATELDTYNIADHSQGTGAINSVTVYIRTKGTSAASSAPALVGSWTGETDFDTNGFSYTPGAGSNRVALVMVTAESNSNPVANINQVTLGGQALTAIENADGVVVGSAGSYHNVVWFGYLNEAGIDNMSGNALNITWDTAPTNSPPIMVQAATYQNVDQTTPVADSASNTAPSAGSIQAGSVSVGSDDRLVYVTVCGNPRDHAAPFGYTEQIEQDGPPMSHSSASVHRDATTSSIENPTADWGFFVNERLAIISAVLNAAGSGASVAAAEVAIRTNGSDYFGSYTASLPTSYTDISANWTENPNTSNDWTWAEIDALEAGVRQYDLGAGDVRTTQVYVEVDYSGSIIYDSPGTLTSVNLLSGETVDSIDSFDYNASAIPSGTSLKVQFSQDSTNWYNSAGTAGGWDTLSQGTNSIDLSGLGWSGANFYYQMEFTSDGTDTPVLDEVGVGFSYYLYYTPGTIASQVLDTGVAGARWDALFWDETLPSNTDITFEVRASNTSFAKNATTPSWTFVGGTSPVTSGLPSGRYLQWRATLTTSDTSKTPTLHEVTIDYY